MRRLHGSLAEFAAFGAIFYHSALEKKSFATYFNITDIFRRFSPLRVTPRNGFKSCQLDNKFVLTFLGKNPNAVAAKYPELIGPAKNEKEKN